MRRIISSPFYHFAMRCLILCGALLSAVILSGQSFFDKSYDVTKAFPPNSDRGWGLVMDADGYTVLSGTLCFGSNYSCTGIVKTDFEGNLLWRKHFQPYPLVLRSGGGIIKTPDGGYAIAGDQYDGNGDYRIFLLRLDNDGDSLWIKFYDDEVKDFARNIILMNDGGFLIHGDGGFHPNGPSDKTIIRTDADGNVLWEKIYDYTDAVINQSGRLTVAPDGSMMMAFLKDFGLRDTVALSKLSADGDLLWTKRFYAEAGFYYPLIKALPNGNFIMVGVRDWDENSWPFYFPVIWYLLDGDGNILIEKYIYTQYKNGIYDFTFAANGDILAAGQSDSIYVENDSLHALQGSGCRIMRLTQDLEVLWDRVYFSFNHPYGGYFERIVEAPDGGIVVSGLVVDTVAGGVLDANVWLVKFDANGCPPEGCTNGNLVILDVDEKNGIQLGKQAWFSISPNPATEQVHVRLFNIFSKETAKLKLFNSAGILMEEMPLQKGFQEKTMDVSSYAAGLYLIVFEEDGIVRQQEKLIIQK